jgi:hypothetical protein
MTTRQVSGTVLLLVGGLGLALAFFGLVAGILALLPFGMVGLILVAAGLVLLASGGGRRPAGYVPRRPGGPVDGYVPAGTGYHHPYHGGGHQYDSPRYDDDSQRGSSGGYDTGWSTDSGGSSGWSGGGDSGGGGGGGGD